MTPKSLKSDLIRFAAAAALATTSTVILGAEPAVDPNPTGWKSTAGANLALNKGNSDTLLAGADILSIKKWDKNEFFIKADAAYGNQGTDNDDRQTTAQNYGIQAHYNRLITDRFFWWLDAAARQDRIANIDYRVTLAAGLGYYFIKTEATQLSGETGPGVVFERVGDKDATYATVRFAEHFRHKFEGGRASIFQNAEFLPRIDDWSRYTVNADIGVEASITEKMGMRVMLVDTYRSDPAPGFKNNDLKLLAGVTYKF